MLPNPDVVARFLGPLPPTSAVTLVMIAACLCLIVLATRLRRATQTLRHQHQALEHVNEHLENVVRLRTRALELRGQELLQANAEMRQLELVRRDFLSNVSHELRTPLTSIRGIADLLRAEADLDPADRDSFVGTIQEQSGRLVRLIDDLITTSQARAGSFPVQCRELEAQATVHSCVAALHNLAATRRIAIATHIDSALPAIWADPDRCAQVVLNLLENALKHAPADSRVEVQARCSPVRRAALQPGAGRADRIPCGLESDREPAAAYVVITVTDQGPGIPGADQQRIFGRFVQLGVTLTNKPPGLGLGLAIAADIAVQHGGALWVESEPGLGATFAASFPVAVSQVPALHS